MGEDRYPDERISGETEKKRAHIRWNIEEGEKSLEELTKQNQLMRWENTVLSDHLTRLVTRKGSELHLQLEALEGEETENADHASKAHKKNTNAMHLVLPSNNGNNNINSEDVAPPDPRTKQSRMQSMRRESKAAGRRARVTTPPETAVPLSLEEKCEIVEDEIAATREQINKLHIESEQTLDDLRAVVEEAELSIVEIKREQATFQREVMFEAELHNSKYASAERVLSYLQEKIKSKRTLIGKLQEKNDILQAQLVEAENQLANKKDLADVLHAVDYDQLTIQNKQLAAKIQDRTHELHRLKAKNNRAAQEQENVLKQLVEATEEGHRIRRLLSEHTPQLNHVKKEIIAATKQKAKLKDLLEAETLETDGPPQPTALEYMRYKEKVALLHKEIRTWQNKLEVVELTTRQLEKQTRSLQKKSSPLDSNMVHSNA